MRKQHFHLLPEFAGNRILLRLGDCTSHIAGGFIDRPGHLTLRGFWTAAWFQATGITVGLTGPVAQHAILIRLGFPWFRERPAILPELLAAWADVSVVRGVINEVGPLDCAVLTAGFIYHRDMRYNPPLFCQPVQHGAGSIGRIGYQPLGLKTKSISDPVHHRPYGANLGLPDRTGGLDIQAHSIAGADQVVRGICKIGRSAPRARSIARQGQNAM